MLQMGIEKEFFIYNNLTNELSLVPHGLPYDNCGWLVECRSSVYNNPTEAVFSLRAEEYKVQNKADKLGYTLVETPFAKIPQQLKIDARRKFAKDLTKFNNYLGYTQHNNSNIELAGVHVSFTSPKTIVDKNNSSITINTNFDWLTIFTTLDAYFIEEIKVAKRRPGFYEVKPDGRVEYRSLPANINLDKLIDVLDMILESKNNA